MGKKVLLVDCDPQGNLTMASGIAPGSLSYTLRDILVATMNESQLPPDEEILIKRGCYDLVPANILLSAAEISLRDEMGSERTLARYLDGIKQDYDYVLIDTNPSLGLLTINTLAAADGVIIPVTPQLWSAAGLSVLMSTIVKVEKRINPGLRVDGVLITQTSEHTLLAREAIKMLEEVFGTTAKIFSARIPMTTKIGEANYSGSSVLNYDKRCKGAEAYSSFAKEFAAAV
jgi:chromosome partitioning protein